MPARLRTWHVSLLIVLLMIVAPALYMGGYYVLLERVRSVEDQPETWPVYRSDSPVLHLFFAPAHQLDRWVRLRHWEKAPRESVFPY